jgi:hypothetical protein
MVLDFSHQGETKVTMKGFVEDMLKSSRVTGVEKTPAKDGLFEVRPDEPLCSEERIKEFHCIVAKLAVPGHSALRRWFSWRHA